MGPMKTGVDSARMAKRKPKGKKGAGEGKLAKREPAPEVVDAELISETEVELADAEPAIAEDEEGSEALIEVAPATDEELDQIEAQVVVRPRAAPAGTSALALRDPMAAYMAEVRRYPLLTREEEHELAVRWVEHGDQEAAKRLVSSNLRLVVKIANEYRRGPPWPA